MYKIKLRIHYDVNLLLVVWKNKGLRRRAEGPVRVFEAVVGRMSATVFSAGKGC